MAETEREKALGDELKARRILAKLVDRVELYRQYGGKIGTAEKLSEALDDARKILGTE